LSTSLVAASIAWPAASAVSSTTAATIASLLSR
jgi:hypothetical protein